MLPIITEQAANDILQIADFHTESVALLITSEVIRQVEDLEIFPLLGRSRDELKKGLRSFVVRKYIVFYTIWQEIPVVVRVVHGSRDLEALFAD